MKESCAVTISMRKNSFRDHKVFLAMFVEYYHLINQINTTHMFV